MAHPRVIIVSPAVAADNNGNWHTAARWRDFLQGMAETQVLREWNGEAADVLIALHARKSAPSIARFRAAHPLRPIALVLTGTDLYRDIDVDADARQSMGLASQLVVLQPLALRRLSATEQAKARVIVQSAPARDSAMPNSDDDRSVFVAVGHLRAEKDPLTLMAVVRQFGPAEGLRVDHIGVALDAALGQAARETMAACPHYRWVGGMSHADTLKMMAGASALVHMSRIEGGAHVIIEAVRAGVPVIASRIDGNVGLLGEDYDGYFPVGDAQALAQALQRFRVDRAWRARLRQQCMGRELGLTPEREAAEVRGLVKDLLSRKR